MEACCRCQAKGCYLWVKPKGWIGRKDEKWITALDLCRWEAKGQGQRRIFPGCTEACRMHKIRGTALNADWNVSKKEQSWIEIISEQQINYSETGGMCWHCFLTRDKEGDFCEGNVADLKESKRCIGSGSADWVQPMGQRNIPWRCWSAWWWADEELPMNHKRKRKSEFSEDLDDSVVIFSIVYF